MGVKCSQKNSNFQKKAVVEMDVDDLRAVAVDMIRRTDDADLLDLVCQILLVSQVRPQG